MKLIIVQSSPYCAPSMQPFVIDLDDKEYKKEIVELLEYLELDEEFINDSLIEEYIKNNRFLQNTLNDIDEEVEYLVISV